MKNAFFVIAIIIAFTTVSVANSAFARQRHAERSAMAEMAARSNDSIKAVRAKASKAVRRPHYSSKHAHRLHAAQRIQQAKKRKHRGNHADSEPDITFY